MNLRYVIGCDAVHPDRRGGQHVAMRCTGVLMIDDERGIGVLCNSERSQHGNKERAEQMLYRLLAEAK
jgi:protein subunit release factor A